MNTNKCNLQIMKPEGGGVKVDNSVVIARTKFYINRKLKKNIRSLDQDEREIIFSVLRFVFEFPVYKIQSFLPWSTSVIYRDAKNGHWKHETLKPSHSFHQRRDDYLSYLLHYAKYLP